MYMYTFFKPRDTPVNKQKNYLNKKPTAGQGN